MAKLEKYENVEMEEAKYEADKKLQSKYRNLINLFMQCTGTFHGLQMSKLYWNTVEDVQAIIEKDRCSFDETVKCSC